MSVSISSADWNQYFSTAANSGAPRGSQKAATLTWEPSDRLVFGTSAAVTLVGGLVVGGYLLVTRPWPSPPPVSHSPPPVAVTERFYPSPPRQPAATGQPTPALWKGLRGESSSVVVPHSQHVSHSKQGEFP